MGVRELWMSVFPFGGMVMGGGGVGPGGPTTMMVVD